MTGLPTGAVTFLFSDIEGSTRLLEHLGDDAFDAVLGEHHRIVREAIETHRGAEVRTVGDAFFIAFASAADAVAAALAAQVALSNVVWPDEGVVRVRMGLHTGPGRLGGDDYVGLAVHQAARISSAAHGGQVVVSESTRHAAGSLPDDASWSSLGFHRLKDMGAAIELFQLCHPELSVDLPPLRTLERAAHNLPVLASSFLGRSDELMIGAKLLTSTRLLSVIGPGGTGKTRLAYQLAAEQVDEFPGGVWVVELASVTDPELVPGALMTALGLRDEPGRAATETIVAHLRDRRALLVLDNCEHVVDAAAALAAALLSGCAHLRVMATTREPLRVTGETVWALDALGLPDDAEMPLEALARTDAVNLFCERAAEARVGFALNSENASAITQICVGLEGIPLAIELAAARVRSLPLAQIAERLDQRLDLLSKGARGASDRQASLRGAIAWSHDLLSEAEQLLFRRLAVFVGGFTLLGAETVCAGDGLNGDDVVDLVDGLVDKSLVSLNHDAGADGRYRLLETIRAYAHEQLAHFGETELLLDRHAAYYAKLADDCDTRRETITALDVLEAEHPNLLAALAHLSARADSFDYGKLVSTLAPFWDLRGYWDLGRRELLAYLARPDRDRTLECHCLGHQGTLAKHFGDYAESTERYEAALLISREVADRRAEARLIGNLGNVIDCLGDYAGARARYDDALSIARETGDRSLEGHTLGNLGNIAHNLGDYPKARALYEEARAIACELGERNSEGLWVGSLGNLATELGDLGEARDLYEDAFAIAREFGDRHLAAGWVGNLGNVAQLLGEFAEARERYGEVLDVAREMGDPSLEGHCLGNLGNVAYHLGELAEARAKFEAALAIARDLGDRRLENYWVGNLGSVAVDVGDLVEARRRMEEALAIARELGDRYLEGYWTASLGGVAVDAGDFDDARVLFEASLAISLELGTEDGNLLAGCAGLVAKLERYADAAPLLGAAEHAIAASGVPRDSTEQARFDAALASCRERLGDEAVELSMKRGGELEWTAAVACALEAIGRP